MQWRGLNKMEEKDYRFKYLEEKVESHDERIKGIEKLSNEFTKISTILEMQTEMNKKQDETLGKINDNLTNLNNTTQRLGERVGHLEGQVGEVTKNDSISVTTLMKRIGWTLFTLVMGGLVTWGFSEIRK